MPEKCWESLIYPPYVSTVIVPVFVAPPEVAVHVYFPPSPATTYFNVSAPSAPIVRLVETVAPPSLDHVKLIGGDNDVISAVQGKMAASLSTALYVPTGLFSTGAETTNFL